MGRSRDSQFSSKDAAQFSDVYQPNAPPVGLDMAGHDTAIMGPKVVVIDSFIVDLLHVDTSAQTFRLKMIMNMDWEDDGTIEPETKAKRQMGSRHNGPCNGGDDLYETGRYTLKREFQEDPLATTWNPEVVLVNAMADEDPIEAGSKFHSVQMLNGRPVISRSLLYQPECRCEFTFQEFPFDETDLVVKFSSNKWSAEEVECVWSHRLESEGRSSVGGGPGKDPLATKSNLLTSSVDQSALGGVGLSEFEIIKVRVETEEKCVNSMQRYDNAQGAFGHFHLIIRVRRDPYSYLLRVASVAELLMFLEVLSFFVDVGDNDSAVNLADRFSISGTNFLAMVSLYGEMADNLPNVSVVTRVDKWHTHNFILLFGSNAENLVAFMLRNYVNIKVMEWTEMLLGILYFVLVVRNAIWFLKPLREREENALLLALWEDRLDLFKEQFGWLVGKGTPPWRRQPTERRSIRRAKSAVEASTSKRNVVDNEHPGENRKTQ